MPSFACIPFCGFCRAVAAGALPVVAAEAPRVFCRIHPIATAESSRAFRWSRLVGVIRPLLNLPYYGNRSIEKQKSHHFCNFFAITDSFLFS